MWPHEVEPWFHSWYRGRVKTLDAKYNLNIGQEPTTVNVLFFGMAYTGEPPLATKTF